MGKKNAASGKTLCVLWGDEIGKRTLIYYGVDDYNGEQLVDVGGTFFMIYVCNIS